jgi:protease IV
MNQSVRRGPIASFFVGLWDVMNFTRRLILNLLFFGLLFLFLIIFVIAASSGSHHAGDSTGGQAGRAVQH